MTQTYKGSVIDEQGLEIEVWVDQIPEFDEPDHVFLMYGGSQIGDFPYNQPTSGNPVAYKANQVAAGVAKQLCVFPDEVIDLDDEGITWH